MEKNIEILLSKENLASSELSMLMELRKEGKAHFTLIDVREPEEIESGYIKGADMFCPTSAFMDHLPQLQSQKEDNLIFYCRSGNRTTQVKTFLKRSRVSTPLPIW